MLRFTSLVVCIIFMRFEYHNLFLLPLEPIDHDSWNLLWDPVDLGHWHLLWCKILSILDPYRLFHRKITRISDNEILCRNFSFCGGTLGILDPIIFILTWDPGDPVDIASWFLAVACRYLHASICMPVSACRYLQFMRAHCIKSVSIGMLQLIQSIARSFSIGLKIIPQFRNCYEPYRFSDGIFFTQPV